MIDKMYITATLYRILNDHAMTLSSATSQSAVIEMNDITIAHFNAVNASAPELVECVENLPIKQWVKAINARFQT